MDGHSGGSEYLILNTTILLAYYLLNWSSTFIIIYYHTQHHTSILNLFIREEEWDYGIEGMLGSNTDGAALLSS
jgi:hypothetical protein